MEENAKKKIIEYYQRGYRSHADGRPETTHYSSGEGQTFRFEKLAEIADLRGCSVLDLGCGIGDLYPFLENRFGEITYTGIDIVPEFIAHAQSRHPKARFFCQDILEQPVTEEFDYVLACGVFNNKIPDITAFMKEMLGEAFGKCKRAMGFNFLSTHVNFVDVELSYHDPADMLDFCIRQLTRKVELHHHYGRCDVAVFAYR